MGNKKSLFLYALASLMGVVYFIALLPPSVYAQTPNSITIQSQINDQYTRILFRMEGIDTFDVALENSTITVDFGQTISTSFDGLKQSISKILSDASISDDSKKLVLKFKNNNFELRKFKSKRFAGIDILPTKEIVEVEPKIATSNVDNNKNNIAISSPRIIPVAKPVNITKNKDIITYGPKLPPVSLARYRVPELKPQSFFTVLSDLVIGPLSVDEYNKKLEDSFQFPPPPPAPGDDWDGAKAITWDDGSDAIALEEKEKAEVATVEEAKPEIVEVKPEPIPEPEPIVEQEIADDDQNFTLKAETELFDDGVKIIFPWENDTAAAVYKRAGYTWAVFDKHEIVDVNKISLAKNILEAEQIFHKDFTIIRMKIGDKNEEKATSLWNTSAYKDDYTWVVEIRKGEQQHAELSATTNIDLSGIVSKVHIPTPTPGRTLKLIDPVIGDRLVVIPLFREKMGVNPPRFFVDFSLIESIQGIAIPIKSDKTFVQNRKNGIIISRREGLSVYTGAKELRTITAATLEKKPSQINSLFPFNSKNFDEELALIDDVSQIPEAEDNAQEDEEIEEEKISENEKPVEVSAFLDKDGQEKNIHEIKQELISDILKTKTKEEKLEKRFRLAKFFFSNQLYAESLGVLEEAVKNNENIQDVKLKAMLGASHYMMGHFVEAAKTFEEVASYATFEEGLEEINLWWWASNNQIRPRSMQTSREIPLKYFEQVDLFLSEYPLKLKQSIGLLAAQQRIDEERYDDARAIIEVVSTNESTTKFIMNSTRYLEAEILEKEDFVDDAIAIWKDLSEETDDRFNRARSTFAMYKLMYTLDRTNKRETIEHLDKLRIVWKGDDFELRLLKFLGGLYIFERDFVNGLRTWRDLVTQFPKTQEALLIARQMKKTFIDLFDKGVAYELNPFVALTLYFEFRELTPVGDVGDNIIRQLVDHFVEADLLENATALLTHQVRFRSEGEQRVNLAVKLGDIHLTNKRPDLTIQALDFVKDDKMVEEIKDKYKYLRARALIQMEEYHKTLLLLSSDLSKTAQTLRLEVFLEQQNWFGIMNITEPRLAEVIDRGDPIKDDSLKDLIMLSISYATQEEYYKLKALQQEFIDKIEDTNGRRIFAFITTDKGAVNHAAFNTTVQLEDISGFVTNYLFWPSREWASVIDTLEPEIEAQGLMKKAELSQDESNQVIQLALSYAMEINLSEDPEKTKTATKGLKRLQRDFSKIQIDERSLPIFLALTNDPELIPDGALKTPTPLKNVETFVSDYQDMLIGSESVL